MTTFTQYITETYYVVSCYACGVRFGISDDLYRVAVQEKKRAVHCPACGKLTEWVGKTEAQKLQEQLALEHARHDQTRAELENTERRRRAIKGQLTKTKNRIAKGICPCCNRHFDNLHKHMTTEHPEFLEDHA